MEKVGRLTKERILRSAINLVDEKGLEGLSMRNLGELLGTGAMSLYNYVGNKEEILDGITELVIAEMHVPNSRSDWRAAMRQRAISMREVVLRHPWAASLLESRKNLGPMRLRSLDASLGSLRQGGFTVDAAARALLLLDSYIFGFTLMETNWRFEASSPAATAEAMRPQVSTDAFPHLTELLIHVTGQTAGTGIASPPLEFEVGLDFILAGLAEKLR